MKAIVNIVAKLSGISALLRAIDGWKVYIAGAIEMLTGLAAIATGVANLLGSLVPLSSAADYWTWFQALGQNPAALAILGGAALIGKGLKTIGMRHAMEKAQAAPSVGPAVLP